MKVHFGYLLPLCRWDNAYRKSDEWTEVTCKRCLALYPEWKIRMDEVERKATPV